MTFWELREPIETERLQLRRAIPEDLEALHSWQSSPEVTRYLPYAPRTRAQVDEGLERSIRSTALRHDRDRVVLTVVRRDDDRVVLTVVRRDDDRAIGELHFVLADASMPGCEVGWVFAPDVAGRGLATEAARAVLEVAFQRGAHRVHAELDARNTASARLCARLGMRQEAHFVKNFRKGGGDWADTMVWAVLAEEWAAHPTVADR